MQVLAVMTTTQDQGGHMHTVRIIAGSVLALSLSGISTLCCYLFGTHLAPGMEGQVYGVLGGVADALKALLPLTIAAAVVSGQSARAVLGIVLFIVFSAYSFTSELGLYALGRDAQTSGTAAGKEQYRLIMNERARLQDRLTVLGQTRPSRTIGAELAGKKQDRSWDSSGQCRNAWRQADRTFCEEIAKIEGELASAEEAERLRSKDDGLAQEVQGMNLADALKSSDAQSEALARMTGFSASSVKDVLAIWVALLIELGSGFGLYAATASGRSSGQKQERSETVLPQCEASAGKIDRQPIVLHQEKKPATRQRRLVLACSDGPAMQSKVGVADDPARLFAKAALVRRDGKELTATDLYAVYARWAELQGQNALSPSALGRRLTAMKFKRLKRGGTIYYQGLDVRPPFQETDHAPLRRLVRPGYR